jgi:hypothetical protein
MGFPTLFRFKIVLAMLNLLNFPMNYGVDLSISAVDPTGILIGVVLNL